MSNPAIREAFETKLVDIQPVLPVAFENVNFTETGDAYEIAYFFFAKPNVMGYGNAPYIQRGYMQVNCAFPTGKGAGPAQNRAELIRDTFHRGLSLFAKGVMVIIEETPEVSGGAVEGDKFVVKVFIRFYAQVGNMPPMLDLDFANGIYKFNEVPVTYESLVLIAFSALPEPGIGLRAFKPLGTGTDVFKKEVWFNEEIVKLLNVDGGFTVVNTLIFDNMVRGDGNAYPLVGCSNNLLGGGLTKTANVGYEPVGFNGRNFDIAAENQDAQGNFDLASQGNVVGPILGQKFEFYSSIDDEINAYYGANPETLVTVNSTGAYPRFSSLNPPVHIPVPNSAFQYVSIRISASGHHDTANQGSVTAGLTLSRVRIFKAAKGASWIAPNDL